ncbi:MAG: tRNA (cytidine(34)-2'-O)-methyltransferase [Defluviitaleaceae bacterium]|nr:tRNA (cytidine(34)-2'-O)-methyltransferase [Defluviitaleaceae bacterium]
MIFLNIVLLEPEIPFNTGNIGRTCVATDSKLHLIKPLGFEIDDKSIKRSGLDYWQDLEVYYYENFADFVEKNNNPMIYIASTKAKNLYSDVCYEEDSFIMFGRESSGTPEEILIQYPETCIRIPMHEKHRSLNLSTSASIVLYEALRQQNFKGLLLEGELRKYKWVDVSND